MGSVHSPDICAVPVGSRNSSPLPSCLLHLPPLRRPCPLTKVASRTKRHHLHVCWKPPLPSCAKRLISWRMVSRPTTNSRYTPTIFLAPQLVGTSVSSISMSCSSAHHELLTTGKHLRHARDHFALLLEVVSQPPPHVLNYDKRARNTPMENSRTAARDALNECIAQLQQVVPHAKWSGPITLHAVTPFPQVMETTFGREVGTPTQNLVPMLTPAYSYGLLVCMPSTIGAW